MSFHIFPKNSEETQGAGLLHKGKGSSIHNSGGKSRPKTMTSVTETLSLRSVGAQVCVLYMTVLSLTQKTPISLHVGKVGQSHFVFFFFLVVYTLAYVN